MINNDQLFTKRNLIIIITVIFCGALIFVAYDNLYFRLKSTDPSLSAIPTSGRSIRYEFSQPIKGVGDILIDDEEVTGVTVDNNVITIPFNRVFKQDSKHTIEITSIESKWFNNKINQINRTFTAQYIDFNALSKTEQNAQISDSNSGQVDDSFISEHVFPIFNERWQIDATVITDNRSVVLNVKFFSEVPNYDNNGAIKRVSDTTAENYRKEVLDKIKQEGGNPDTYTIIYDNPYLYKKYSENESH